MSLEYHFEDRVIAFIDILGFREHVKRAEIDTDHAKLLHHTLNFIMELKSQNEHGTLSQQEIGKEVSVFSDSIVLSYPLSLKSSCFYILLDIVHLQLEMMNLGILMRGGVTVGKLYHKNNVVYGPAMVEAYDIESKLAIYPRVLVNEEVIKRGLENGNHSPVEELNHLIGLLAEDEDHQLFIDYMSQSQEVDEPSSYLEALEKTKTLIENQLTTLKKPNVLLKYLWLKRYYNSTMRKIAEI